MLGYSTTMYQSLVIMNEDSEVALKSRSIPAMNSQIKAY
jgi:hypothetical protein